MIDLKEIKRGASKYSFGHNVTKQAKSFIMDVTNNSNMSVNVTVPVTVNGNADESTIAKMQQGIDSAVEKALARIQHQKGRVSYA